MPPAAPIRPRRLVPTQQGVGTLAPNDLTAFRDALQVFSASLRKPARRYAYRGLKIFTSLSLRFQDFQRVQGVFGEVEGGVGRHQTGHRVADGFAEPPV